MTVGSTLLLALVCALRHRDLVELAIESAHLALELVSVAPLP